MNNDLIRMEVYGILMAMKPAEALKRLKRGEGSGALTGFSDAKRAEEPGSAEGLPQSLAVSPGLAEAAIIELIAKMESQSDAANHAAYELIDQDQEEKVAYQDGLAYAYNQCAEWLYGLLPKPDSERRGKPVLLDLSQESPEASATPSNGTASGRRNGKFHNSEFGEKP